MKKLFTLLALTISFSMNAQLTSVSEGGNTGQRLTTSNSSNHGDIGDKAVDLSFSGSSSSTNGATGEYSISMGRSTIASGINSTSMGIYTTASGNYSTAMGRGTVASGTYSTAIGRSAEATGDYSTATGSNTTASGDYSTAMGYYTTASGDVSTAMGSYTTANDYASVVIGQYNSSGSSVTNSASMFSTSNTAFVIGNGADSSNKSDAFKVMFNGNTTIGGDDLTIGDLSAFSGSFTQRSAIDVVAHSDGDLITGYLSGSTGDRFNIELDSSNSLAKISSGGGYDLTFSTEGGTMNFESNGFGTGTYVFNGDATVSNDLTVSGDVVISSDARLKSNIVSLGSTLPKLLQIDGKSYEMKGKQKIGVLAQEIKEVFPELVSEDDNEMLAVNYQGLVPVLINALKERDTKMKEQETKYMEQEKRLEKLERLVANMY